jgi:hypothetical protein
MTPSDAYQYALNVVKGRFPEGESAIATDPTWSYYYAKNVIQGRFPEGESAIATNSDWAYNYAKNVIRNRWPDGEAIIATSPKWVYRYAWNIISRCPDGDPELPKKLLADEHFIINNVDKYTQFVKGYFNDNSVMINKWLRYAENIRSL